MMGGKLLHQVQLSRRAPCTPQRYLSQRGGIKLRCEGRVGPVAVSASAERPSDGGRCSLVVLLGVAPADPRRRTPGSGMLFIRQGGLAAQPWQGP